jgi:methylmalonyl-CoA carboxyltransferase 1.3S subunit
MRLELQVAGKRFHVEVAAAEPLEAAQKRKRALPSIQSFPLPDIGSSGEDHRICRSPVNGIVVEVSVQVGDVVCVHDSMLVLEAMKMQTKLTAPSSGRLKCVHVAPGQAVKANQVLLEFEELG